MAKHSVPKKKQSKTRSNTRYHTFEKDAQRRLLNGAKAQIHRLKKAQPILAAAIEKKAENVTKIQA